MKTHFFNISNCLIFVFILFTFECSNPFSVPDSVGWNSVERIDISFGNSDIQWGPNVDEPEDVGYKNYLRKKKNDITSPNLTITFNINSSNYSRMAVYAFKGRFKFDAFHFLKNDSIVGSLFDYSYCTTSGSSNGGLTIDSSLAVVDGYYSEIGPENERSDYHCHVFKFLIGADFDAIRVVFLP